MPSEKINMDHFSFTNRNSDPNTNEKEKYQDPDDLIINNSDMFNEDDNTFVREIKKEKSLYKKQPLILESLFFRVKRHYLNTEEGYCLFILSLENSQR